MNGKQLDALHNRPNYELFLKKSMETESFAIESSLEWHKYLTLRRPVARFRCMRPQVLGQTQKHWQTLESYTSNVSNYCPLYHSPFNWRFTISFLIYEFIIVPLSHPNWAYYTLFRHAPDDDDNDDGHHQWQLSEKHFQISGTCRQSIKSFWKILERRSLQIDESAVVCLCAFIFIPFASKLWAKSVSWAKIIRSLQTFIEKSSKAFAGACTHTI